MSYDKAYTHIHIYDLRLEAICNGMQCGFSCAAICLSRCFLHQVAIPTTQTRRGQPFWSFAAR